MLFSFDIKNKNGFDTFILKDNIAQTKVEIIPACGGILHGFSVVSGGKYLNLIQQYENAGDFKLNVEKKGFKSCKLSPFACRVNNAKYTFEHQKYKFNKFMLGDNALHGLLYDANFSVVNHTANNDFAGIELLHQYRAADKGYPFNYDCKIGYYLKKDNRLIIETTICNMDKKNIPVQDGWHPYFTFDKPIDKLQLQIKTVHKVELDASLIPSGKTTAYNEFENLRDINNTIFDDCFMVKFEADHPVCILKDPAQNVQVEIYPDETYPYLQLFTPNDRTGIAIENLSAIPDAFNNEIGLITLAPQKSKKFTTTYKITLLK